MSYLFSNKVPEQVIKIYTKKFNQSSSQTEISFLYFVFITLKPINCQTGLMMMKSLTVSA